MIVHTNILALNTLGNLNKNEKKSASSLEKLSSGLGINKAADDAAGLSISEKMRGQIRGLSQANRNIQDGTSLVQVTDGGLGQIMEQLQRAREITVQAANGTLTSEDRQSLQKEIDQIVKGIDHVANYTEFNSINVLAPPVIAIPVPNPNTVDIVFVVDNTGSMYKYQTPMANNISSMLSQMGTADVRLGLVSYDDGNGIRKFDFSTNQWTLGTPIDEWTQNAAPVSNALTSIVNNGGTENAMQAIDTVVSQYSFRNNSPGVQTKHIILLTDEDASDAVSNAPAPALMTKLTTDGIRIHTVYNPAFVDGDDASDITDLAVGTGGTTVDIMNSAWGSQLSSVLGAAIGQSAGSAVSQNMPTLLLQVGANSNQDFEVELFDARAKKIGIDPLIIDPWTKAEESISKVDAAVEIISGQRGKFGAYQNALEHIAANVANAEENLTAAESGIRDLDMAKEMIQLKKNDIINQAAQAMLAQANQQPKGVLELLR